MNSQNKLINDILSTYNNILENKRIVERAQDLRNTLSKLGYQEKGNELTSGGGDVNTKLTTIVSELLTTFKENNPDVKVRITSGNDAYHKGLDYNSKHKSGDAIDLTIEPYNSETSKSFISLVKNFQKKYPDLGFIDEYTNPSRAATGKHYHLQLGRTQDSTSSTTTKPTTSSTNTGSVSNNSTDNDEDGGFIGNVAKSLVNAIGIKESLDYESLGKKTILRFGDVLIPKKDNSNIKSPVSGVVSKYFNDCDGLTIKFDSEGKTLYLNYCGIESSRFRINQKIKKGETIGSPDYDVKVSLFDSKGNKQQIKSNKKTDSDEEWSSFFKSNNKKTNYSDERDSKDYSRYEDDLARELIKMKDNLFKVNKKNKIEENIKRIKGLL